ncbi:hypothetical protein JTE90_001825 [Oedothorax gibbosus]|uniref:Uncharacterized protein n=1 Tax=Oedothorax gibbosus TaxID=931172 RepID=A0AAV6U1U8_9ARAC|nr:hypothetical protein JTE90_001825 [Oedothorax gibbosus]
MRKQRFAYTLPAQNDFVISPEENDVRNIFPSQFSMQDSVMSQIFAAPEQEPVAPYFMYQYPLIPVHSVPFQSVTSILSNQSAQFYPYESFADFDQMPLVLGSSANSPPISVSSYGDCTIPPPYIPENLPPFQFSQLNGNLLQDLSNGSLLQDLSNGRLLQDLSNGRLLHNLPNPFPIVTNYGTATILLRHLIRVDVSADKSVFLTNLPAECAAVMNSNGDRCGVIHPNGRVLQDYEEIHMTTLDKKAKISKRGIVFTSSNHCLSYLVDASGTKTTSDKFRDLSRDFSNSIFNSNSAKGALEKCSKMAEEAVHKRFKNGDEVWMLGGIRIKQDHWGDVTVSRFFGRQMMKASPTSGRISVTTEDCDISVGRYHENYFNVRKGNQRVTASLRAFNVQSGTQKSGFNKNGRLVIK